MSRPNYATYLPLGEQAKAWGVGVSAAGFTRVGPHDPYPRLQHPIDHLFTGASGRVLEAYQIVYILAGGGSFASATSGEEVPVEAGTLFLLFPGVWHRYAPEPGVGWVETWIEASGAALDRLYQQGVIDANRPVHQIGLQGALLEMFDRCHDLIRDQPRGYGPVVGTLVLQILARLDLGVPPGRDRPIDRAVQAAQARMAQSLDTVLTIEALAASLNVGYTYFRRAFKEATGVSPKQYHLELRLRKAMQLIGSTDLPIQKIAEMLAFDSPSYLSALIKARTGSPPSTWREKGRQDT